MEAKEILKSMTLDEKVALTIGVDFWQTQKVGDVPALFMCDGPTGLRKQDPEGGDMLGINRAQKATCFPTAVTLAGTWDPETTEEIGRVLGEEARDQKVGMVLGPGLNVKRDPRCGRNFEYYSEDPLLAGRLAGGVSRGIESLGVASCLKHFACNSQETDRFTSDGIIDDRTLREIYLRAFEIAVKEADPSAVMSSYPMINGVHASTNAFLLDTVLRGEWGFHGMVVTDWGGMADRIEGLRAGNDLTMPGGSNYMHSAIVKAVKDEVLPEEAVDRCAGRILELMIKEAEVLKEDFTADYEAHHRAAMRAVEEGTVLLKNDGNLLPLGRDRKIAVVGWMAKDIRYQGAGSSHVNAINLRQPLDLLKACAYAQGCNEDGSVTEELLDEVRRTASGADAVVVFAGLPPRYESEGFDRDDLKMPEGHVRMIGAAAEANPDTAVVLLCGAPVECPWADKVKTILYPGLPGESGAEAVVRILFGDAEPSGRLAETWPFLYEDAATSACYGATDAEYREGVYVGYRYYDRAGKEVRWPFGHGLSYTSFEYSDLRVDGNEVSLKVANTGDRSGRETVQLYAGPADAGGYRPLRELKAFRKISLQPGETAEVRFTLSGEDFRVWDGGWKTAGGRYAVSVGRSSRDLPLAAEMEVKGEEISFGMPEGSWYLDPSRPQKREDWIAMLGHDVVKVPARKGSYTRENTVAEMRKDSLIMKIMYRAIESTIAKGFGGKPDYDNPDFRMMMNASAGSPLRSMQANGGMSDALAEGLLEMANGHPLKGIVRMIRR